MRVFKYGDTLAIVFPGSLIEKARIREGMNLEFLELSPGVFVLVEKERLESEAKNNIVLEMVKKISNAKTDSSEKPVNLSSQIDVLEKQGYLLLDTEGAARSLSELLKTKGRDSDVTGIRGFDKKYYILLNSFYGKYSDKTKSILQSGPKDFPTLCAELKLNSNACGAVLQIMREEGYIIEKRKGVFSLV